MEGKEEGRDREEKKPTEGGTEGGTGYDGGGGVASTMLGGGGEERERCHAPPPFPSIAPASHSCTCERVFCVRACARARARVRVCVCACVRPPPRRFHRPPTLATACRHHSTPPAAGPPRFATGPSSGRPVPAVSLPVFARPVSRAAPPRRLAWAASPLYASIRRRGPRSPPRTRPHDGKLHMKKRRRRVRKDLSCDFHRNCGFKD